MSDSRKVSRADVVDYQTYTDRREAFRERVLAAKAPRRVHVGEHLTFLFENKLTILYQIQEMMRVERIVRETEIQHEIDTYNELIGERGELGCTLLVEIDSPEERAVKLREWLELPKFLYAELEDGTRVPAQYDERQIGDDRLSSVQYMRFDTGGEVPVALGSALPQLEIRTELTKAQRAALAKDVAA